MLCALQCTHFAYNLIYLNATVSRSSHYVGRQFHTCPLREACLNFILLSPYMPKDFLKDPYKCSSKMIPCWLILRRCTLSPDEDGLISSSHHSSNLYRNLIFITVLFAKCKNICNICAYAYSRLCVLIAHRLGLLGWEIWDCQWQATWLRGM